MYGCPLAKKRKALEKQPLEPAAKRRPFLSSCPGEEEEEDEEDISTYSSYEKDTMEVGEELDKEHADVMEEEGDDDMEDEF